MRSFFSKYPSQKRASPFESSQKTHFFPPSIQRLATPDEEKMPGTNDARMREDKMIQEKPEIQRMGGPEEDEMLQGKAENSAGLASPQVSNQIENNRGKGRALPENTRAEMEAGIGADFSGVNIHTDDKSAGLSQSLHAQAFTTGQDVFFNAGKFQPDTQEGKKLLAHELVHVTQQQTHLHRSIQRSWLDDASAWLGNAAEGVSNWAGGVRQRADEAQQIPRQRPERDDTGNFCSPYTSYIEAAAAKIYVRTVLPAASAGMFGSEVAGLWNQYLNGPSSGRRKFVDGTTIGYGFSSSAVIRSRVNLLMRIAAARYSLFESITPNAWTNVPVEDIYTPDELTYGINFSNPFDIPGHIAGGVSGSDYGPDTRQLKGNIQAYRETDIDGNTIGFKLKSSFEFEVLDAVDFCPGGMGAAGLETLLTIPLSRLEATGMAWDVPFQVNFTPTPVETNVTPSNLPGTPGTSVGFGTVEQADDRRSRGDRTRETERALSEKDRINQRTGR
ncbi:MAG: DUF4157 domain-containing protein [Saprospiraceae bacterium]|nr:DUF4157 domain-containing protein [Saprospiraceae bacterium]